MVVQSRGNGFRNPARLVAWIGGKSSDMRLRPDHKQAISHEVGALNRIADEAKAAWKADLLKGDGLAILAGCGPAAMEQELAGRERLPPGCCSELSTFLIHQANLILTFGLAKSIQGLLCLLRAFQASKKLFSIVVFVTSHSPLKTI